MATNIDKALYQLPVGMDEDLMDAEPIEIEIEDPEAVSIGIGDLEIGIEMGEKIKRWTARRKSALVLDKKQGKTTEGSRSE